MTRAGDQLLSESWHLSTCVLPDTPMEPCACRAVLAMAIRDIVAEATFDAASRVTTVCLDHGIRPAEFIAAVKISG